MKGTNKAQSALRYLEEHHLGPLLDRLLERYRRLGRIGQRMTVPPGPLRDALADLLGIHISRIGPFTLHLSDLDRALQESRFGISLAGVLQERADGPLTGSRERREQREARWQDFLASLAQNAADLGLAREWEQAEIENSATLSYLHRHWSEERSDRLQEQAGRALRALRSLPLSPPQRLPVFAQRVLGDPHALDLGTVEGGLLQRILEDRGPSLEESAPVAPTERRYLLLSRVGLLVDDLSSRVLVSGLASGSLPAGREDPLAALSANDPAPLILPLARLTGWQAAQAQGHRAFLVENASVFGALLDLLGPRLERTLVCTGGQLSAASLRLLDLLVQGGATLDYSGDFDGAGLGIAAGLKRRYGERLHYWFMDPESYRVAATRSTVALTDRDRSLLGRLEAEMPDLVAAMREVGMAGYQEALLEDLAASLAARD